MVGAAAYPNLSVAYPHRAGPKAAEAALEDALELGCSRDHSTRPSGGNFRGRSSSLRSSPSKNTNQKEHHLATCAMQYTPVRNCSVDAFCHELCPNSVYQILGPLSQCPTINLPSVAGDQAYLALWRTDEKQKKQTHNTTSPFVPSPVIVDQPMHDVTLCRGRARFSGNFLLHLNVAPTPTSSASNIRSMSRAVACGPLNVILRVLAANLIRTSIASAVVALSREWPNVMCC